MNKTMRLFVCFFLFCLVFSAFAQSYDNLTTDAASQLIKNNEGNTSFIVLDVRTPEEFTQGHIKNSQNIDFYNSNFSQEISKLEKKNLYLVYCRSGRRSAGAAEQMKALGFEKVANMLGGITKWSSEARPIEK